MSALGTCAIFLPIQWTKMVDERICPLFFMIEHLLHLNCVAMKVRRTSVVTTALRNPEQ